MGKYPHIERAAITIAYANGCINRDTPEEKVWLRVERFLGSGEYANDTLSHINEWLGGLSEHDLGVICDGEQDEMQKILRGAPRLTAALLEAIFHHVC